MYLYKTSRRSVDLMHPYPPVNSAVGLKLIKNWQGIGSLSYGRRTFHTTIDHNDFARNVSRHNAGRQDSDLACYVAGLTIFLHGCAVTKNFNHKKESSFPKSYVARARYTMRGSLNASSAIGLSWIRNSCCGSVGNTP